MSATHDQSVELLDFTADNVAPVAEEVMAAVIAANRGYAAPYGGDSVSRQVSSAIAALLKRAPEDGATIAFAVSSGVAANTLALAAVTVPGGLIFCHEHAHIRVSEHGAPQQQTGCDLVPVPDDGHGRITPGALAATIARHHPAANNAVSLTNQTEAGTVYSSEQLAVVTQIAREHGLAVHLDGARLANAAVAVGGDDAIAARQAMASLTWRAGVDAVSIGLTKNGGMSADTVVFFDQEIAERFPALRDRAGQRPSKMRFLSSQVLAVAENDDWVGRAAHANRMAAMLAAKIGATLDDVSVARAVEGNHVFVRLEVAHRAQLQQAGFKPHSWPRFGENVVRLVTNWTTTPEQIDRLVNVLAGQAE